MFPFPWCCLLDAPVGSLVELDQCSLPSGSAYLPSNDFLILTCSSYD
jgi:hypothetical protein